MFGIHNYGSFIAAVLVFQLIPGAGTISILNATARNGMGGGMKAVFGTLSGDLVYMCAAVLGLAAILSAYPGVLAGAQWIGAGVSVLAGYQTADHICHPNHGAGKDGAWRLALFPAGPGDQSDQSQGDHVFHGLFPLVSDTGIHAAYPADFDGPCFCHQFPLPGMPGHGRQCSGRKTESKALGQAIGHPPGRRGPDRVRGAAGRQKLAGSVKGAKGAHPVLDGSGRCVQCGFFIVGQGQFQDFFHAIFA